MYEIGLKMYEILFPHLPFVPNAPFASRKRKRTITVRFHVVLIVYELVFHCLHGLYAESRKPSHVSDAIATFQ